MKQTEASDLNEKYLVLKNVSTSPYHFSPKPNYNPPTEQLSGGMELLRKILQEPWHCITIADLFHWMKEGTAALHLLTMSAYERSILNDCGVKVSSLGMDL